LLLIQRLSLNQWNRWSDQVKDKKYFEEWLIDSSESDDAFVVYNEKKKKYNIMYIFFSRKVDSETKSAICINIQFNN